MSKVTELFGSHVFNDQVMKERLPAETYQSLLETTKNGHHLNPEIASVMAKSMKEWAIENGATHFTHWFQPMTGFTAEKHDSFIVPKEDGKVIEEFSGKELIRGEPDASSFPSGGLRATFEARGYTAWDPSSYVFIKDDTLCIPTAFCSWGGESLDEKTPLLRSMEAMNRQTMRILKLFGNETAHSVKTMVGPEQEYFLVDQKLYEQRKDLVYTGRTLFGARPPKGQDLEDHYFGTIKPRVAAFMKELDEELWKLGVTAKTEHNETAPAQHELATIYTTANIASDHNQLTMETMQKVAKKHGMVCLLHEKPFDGVNGSGKHNNWSINTDSGMNLLDPGDTPSQNAQFLLFLVAVIQAVDDYQDMLRVSVATPGNDHRLGANEAPPAIVSIFLGEEITSVLEAIEKDQTYDTKAKSTMKVGVHILPRFSKDNTDRNRTSPFAFTGNKFEFRMLGSSTSISSPNTVLNTAVAESLCQFADILEQAPDFDAALHNLIKTSFAKHKRIIFNGNGYDDAWLKEAKARGLLNYPTTPDALPAMLMDKNIALFCKHKVFSETEMRSRFEIREAKYCKSLHIEALTMIDMVREDILPSVSRFTMELARAAEKKLALAPVDVSYEKETVVELSSLMGKAASLVATLEDKLEKAKGIKSAEKEGLYYKDNVLETMKALRQVVDAMELKTDASLWPYPSCGDLLFSVQ